MPSKLLTVIGFAVLVMSVVLLIMSTDVATNLRLSYVLAIVGYVVAAAADTLDRRRRDRAQLKYRFKPAVVIWSSALVVAAVAGYFAASDAAL